MLHNRGLQFYFFFYIFIFLNKCLFIFLNKLFLLLCQLIVFYFFCKSLLNYEKRFILHQPVDF